MLSAICSQKDLTHTEYYNCVCDIIDCQLLEQLKGITHHISTTRFQHCINVSYYGYLLCKKLHFNARSAARAGLLHDLFLYDRKEYNSLRTKGQLKHSRMHSLIAAENAANITIINALERDIIEKHMWPMTKAIPKYRESYLMTFVDKYCAILEFCIPKIKNVIGR